MLNTTPLLHFGNRIDHLHKWAKYRKLLANVEAGKGVNFPPEEQIGFYAKGGLARLYDPYDNPSLEDENRVGKTLIKLTPESTVGADPPTGMEPWDPEFKDKVEDSYTPAYTTKKEAIQTKAKQRKTIRRFCAFCSGLVVTIGSQAPLFLISKDPKMAGHKLFENIPRNETLVSPDKRKRTFASILPTTIAVGSTSGALGCLAMKSTNSGSLALEKILWGMLTSLTGLRKKTK